MLIRTDLIGRRNGKIQIVSFNTERSKKASHWNYICDCGNSGVIAAGEFNRNRSTSSKSCGCAERKTLSLIGHKYGKLTPTALAPKKGVKYYWLCKCDCGREKSVPESSLRKGCAKTCGMCQLEGDDYTQSKMDILMSHIDKVPSGCWMWTGRVDKDGYGSFPSRRFDQRAHRASYKLYVGEITHGLWVLHKCDVPGCANPEHLYLGDVRQNVKDAMERGRLDTGPNSKKGRKGMCNGRAKLSDEDVLRIKSMGNINFQMRKWLANSFSVGPTTITNIVKGKTWTSL